MILQTSFKCRCSLTEKKKAQIQNINNLILNTMKKLFSIMAVATALFAGYSAYSGQNSNELTDVALANVEALAGATDDSSQDYGKLKIVNCKCDNGKSGYTLRCRPNGTLEKCSATQQGLIGCYKTKKSFSNPIDLICEKAESYEGE